MEQSVVFLNIFSLKVDYITLNCVICIVFCFAEMFRNDNPDYIRKKGG